MTDLRHALDDYLTIRRALGFKLERAGLLLADFVGYLETNALDTIAIRSGDGVGELAGPPVRAGVGERS